jgi:DNA (cytosine-5)-methyltransferase 1
MNRKVVKFVDLFCGIGGFHSALSQLGHKCVFACDTDKDAAKVYQENFGISAHKDIRDCRNLPDFDILCAGFPCQPFSKSGLQKGFNDQTRGTLFHEIMRIVVESKPKILFLENVPNLLSHDEGNTYRIIKQSIESEGYNFSSSILSPHSFGTPQIRKRLYMVAIKKDLCNAEDFNFPVGLNLETNIESILDKKNIVEKKYHLSKEEIDILEHWNYFIKNIGSNKTPCSPTWSQEFGRSYPLEKIHPITKKWRVTVRRLKQIVENDGIIPNESRLRTDIIKQFPPYIISAKKPLPEWKKKFINNNRDKWNQISNNIGQEWLMKTRTFKETYQKFEWQVGDEKRDIWKHIIQLRPSGIRVKKSNYIPALVAIAQIPIIGWQKRKMTPKECARAQDFDVDGLKGSKYILSKNDSEAYKQLGNAVNVKLTKIIMEEIENYIG